ncbi:uncharacterized protein TRAVEDRAFT_47067 [Trametes versicolor FP-101664 SS1]|uniref:uncharacterized protein n=1 Tax=Trametes versicolor (strain FP-101664) TaxID=717944 RepID=UPI000462151B|nr:uncharacterized protein TRAVEDRAFT_47067 [Trametes versicolor FP-101664 SS1]EIW59766.1 hypothetical protein TRAVEDRAFT_47067 [Trametes versicolor FP-101664 SS1]
MADFELDGNANLVDRERNRIPEPRKVSHSAALISMPGNLADQMRLGGTDDGLRLFAKLVEKIANLSEDHKDTLHLHRVTVKSQEWQAFVDLVKRELPVLDAYENCWPVAAIVREHRRRSFNGRKEGLLRWQSKAPAELADDLRRAPSPLPRDDSEQAPVAGPSGMAHDDGESEDYQASAQDADAPNLLPMLRSRASREPSVELKMQASSSCPGSGNRAPATRGARRTGARADRRISKVSVRAGHGADAHHDAGVVNMSPVLDFLSKLRPEQTRLLPVLAAKGIVDGAALDGFAHFPAKQRKSMLNSWLREEAITELQFEVLNGGFERMGAGAAME